MEINTLDDLDKLDLKIRQEISKYRLGDVLYSLYEIKNSLRPFIAAGVALFAIRFSEPSIVSQNYNLLNLNTIIRLVSDYLLADPITFDQELENNFMGSNPAFVMLRLACSQFPFEVSEFSQFSRPILLYHEIPNSLVGKAGIPKFDIHKEFLILNGVSIHEFINIGFAASAFAKNNFAFSLNLFAKVRSQGISLLDDQAISQAVYQLAGDQVKITTLYDKRKNTDRRFRMYDFNPLRTYPLVFPCGFGNLGQDFMCAPLPGLIDDKMSIGIYYQLFNKFKNKFSDYFGYVLEEYLKLILNNSITSEKIIDIRDLDLGNQSKSPDYAIIDGSVAIVLECKATKFTLAAQTISSEEAIKDSLKQVIKGLIQIDTFIKACKAGASNLAEFHECSTFMPVLVTLEEMYLINSDDFRDYINNELLKNEGIVNLDWQILSIGELERLQPHLAAGIHLSQVLQDLKHKTFNSVLKELASQTRKTFKDCFLYPKQKELYQRLGIPDRSEEKNYY